MDTHSIASLSNKQLAQLLQFDDRPAWNDIENAQVLAHQLRAPLLNDLALMPDVTAQLEELRRQINAHNIPSQRSFLDHLTTLAPLLDALRLIKSFARQARGEATNPLRGTPATVLYYAAIAAALLRCGQKISQVSDSDLRDRFLWSGRQKGAEQLNALFLSADAVLPSIQSKDVE